MAWVERKMGREEKGKARRRKEKEERSVFSETR